VLLFGVLDHLRPLLLHPAAHRQPEFGQRGVGVGQQPHAEPLIQPGPRDQASAVGRRGARQERPQGAVQFPGVDKAALLQQPLDAADPGGQCRRRAGMVCAHRVSSVGAGRR
jgi:hypothetical protein